MNPLDQLRDIHPPPTPPWWPPGPAWWIVAALLCCLLLGAGWWAWRRHQRRAYRRAAQAELTQLAARGAEYDIQTLLALVRRTARAGNHHSPWPALPATALLERIDRCSNGRLGEALRAEGTSLDDLAQHQYRRQDDCPLGAANTLHHWCDWWTRHHREADLC